MVETSLFRNSSFSVRRMSIFGVIFVSVGVYLLIHSFAATPANTEVQDLIDAAQTAGLHNVDLANRNYDNSGGLLNVPVGMNLNCHQGISGSAPYVVLQNQASQSQAIAQGFNTIQNCRFIVSGHPNDVGPSASMIPGLGYGFKIQSHVTFQNNRVEGGLFGVEVQGDHPILIHNVLTKAYYGLFVSSASSRGNMYSQDNDFTGNAMASVAVSPDTEIDSWLSQNDHLGFSPYCFFAEGRRSTNAHEYAITNIEAHSWSCESSGNRMIQAHDRKISGTLEQPHTGPLVGSAFTSSVPPPTNSGADTNKAAIEAGNLPSRVLDGNQWLILSAGGDDTNGSFTTAQGQWIQD